MKHILQQLKVCLLFSILIFVTTALSQQKMYWSEIVDNPKIRRANLEGSNIEDILTIFTSGFAGVTDIDIDNVGGKIYWTNSLAGKIQRADLDGNNLVDILTGLSNPFSIALDISSGKMYWTTVFPPNMIQRANLDGSNIEDLVDLGNVFPAGLTLDPIGEKIYWVTGAIQRADLDGSNVELLLQVSEAGSITLDTQGGKMYWVVSSLSDPEIVRANLDGSNMEILVDNSTATLERLWDIALDLPAGKMYWIDLIAEKIQRANLDGSNVEDIITSGLNSPGYINILPAPTAVDEDVTTIPNKYVLKQNFPNPFNPSTTIKFSIPSQSFTTLKVYDILGNEIVELVNEQLSAGNYKFNFAAESASGGLPSGIYFYRITSGSFTAVKKMTLLK